MISRISCSIAFAFFSLLAAPAQSQVTFFGEDLFGFSPSEDVSDRSSVFPEASSAENLFLDLLTTNVGTETFESGFSHNQQAPIDLLFPDVGTATLNGSGRIHQYSAPCPAGSSALGNWCGHDRYPTSGDFFFDTPAGGDFRIVFEEPVAAFGFFGVDVGDAGGQLFLDFVNSAGATTIEVPHTLGTDESTTGAAIFFGFINPDDPFVEVHFRNNSSTDLFAFDNMTAATASQVIPEPGTLALVGAGFASLAARRRR